MTTPVSKMAETLIGSEIIGLASRVKELIRQGQPVHNLTIGDFDSKLFPIPDGLTDAIVAAYREGVTSYPAAEGIKELRVAVSAFLKARQSLDVDPEHVLIAGGARPLILSTYMTVVDPGEKVVFPVPSWNNNHYCHLMRAQGVLVETAPSNRFMPTASELRPHLAGASLLAICSPLNPTGTTFTAEGLAEICDLVLEENGRRKHGAKPLYLMYDQIYNVLTSGVARHQDPVRLRPAMRDYTIFIDGISKSFAATGVRVGWAFGPPSVLSRMKPILSHVGAWAPHAEQVATARYLARTDDVARFLDQRTKHLSGLLEGFHRGFVGLQKAGLPVDVIAPEGAIYLTVKIDPRGKKTPEGHLLATMKDVSEYLLQTAHVALVPFSAFGAPADSPWYRLSVGTATADAVEQVIASLHAALTRLT